MIPGLPKWDETDNVSKPYQGSQIKPPPEKWWKHFALSLGPKEYGVHGGDLAARWWAVYIQPLNNFQAIWIVPARLDGLGWDRPRLFHTFSYARFTKIASLGFNKDGNAVVSILHSEEDMFGPPNSITTYSFGLDYSGNPGISEKYIMNVRCPVVANSKPTDPNAATYLFFIDNTNILSYVTDQGTGTIDFATVVKSRQLGPSWEILNGGYRVDGKFQLTYRHDADDPLPPDVVPPEEYTYGELISSPYPYKATIETNPIPKASVSTASLTTVTPTVESANVAKSLGTISSIVITEPLITLPIVESAPLAVPTFDLVSVEDTIVVKPVTEVLPTNLALSLGVKLTTTRVGDDAVSTNTIGVPTISNITVTTL